MARRGGLAVQRLYRKFGVHPTAAATRARLDRRERQQHAAAVPPSPVVALSGAPPPIEAALWSRGSSTAARLAAAWAYLQPIGRRERLEEERRRR